MDRLRLLMVQNQSYLGKLRARAIYCVSATTTVTADFHKHYGAFAGYWDEWYVQAEEMREYLCANIAATDVFLAELWEYMYSIESKKRLSRADKSYLIEVTSLAEGRLAEQKELLEAINERVRIHREFTEKLLLVEAIDSLGDEW